MVEKLGIPRSNELMGEQMMAIVSRWTNGTRISKERSKRMRRCGAFYGNVDQVKYLLIKVTN